MLHIFTLDWTAWTDERITIEILFMYILFFPPANSSGKCIDSSLLPFSPKQKVLVSPIGTRGSDTWDEFLKIIRRWLGRQSVCVCGEGITGSEDSRFMDCSSSHKFHFIFPHPSYHLPFHPTLLFFLCRFLLDYNLSKLKYSLLFNIFQTAIFLYMKHIIGNNFISQPSCKRQKKSL